MRGAILPYIGWISALQSWGFQNGKFDDFARLLALAGMLGTLTVLIYRLGVWRQEMENTRSNIAAEVKAHRGESAANFDRIERRLEAIDHVLARSSENRQRAARWQSRTERRLERLESVDPTKPD